MAKCVMGITAVVVATVAGLQVRKAWTADERPGPPSAQITVIADPPIPPKTKITVSGDAEKYPYELPIELGDQDFAADDRITIQQIRGTKSDVAADGDYQICGTYTLASADSAELAVQSGNKISRQPVTKGTGPYVLTLIGGAAGFPRVAFLKGKLHIPFGIVWFGHGDTVFKAARLNQKVPFEIGNTNFRTGDSITVTSVESDRTTFEVGGLYRVSGTYTLGSQDGAAIAIFGTLPTVGPEATQAIDAMRFVPKGDGKFTLIFKLMGPCWPHVSYYPSAGGEGFGGTYFGTGNFLLKSEPGQRPTQNKKAEKDEF